MRTTKGVNEMDYVTVNEAADFLGVSRRKVARMIASGELDVRESKLDKRRRLIPRVQIEEMLETEGRRQAPRAELK
jgi:excisionase family DNA binding protein